MSDSAEIAILNWVVTASERAERATEAPGFFVPGHMILTVICAAHFHPEWAQAIATTYHDYVVSTGEEEEEFQTTILREIRALPVNLQSTGRPR